MIVPAVAEVCRPQPAHSQVGRWRVSAHPEQLLQQGQTKPPGQRRCQEPLRAPPHRGSAPRSPDATLAGRSSSGTAWREHCRNTAQRQAFAVTTYGGAGAKRISLIARRHHTENRTSKLDGNDRLVHRATVPAELTRFLDKPDCAADRCDRCGRRPGAPLPKGGA